MERICHNLCRPLSNTEKFGRLRQDIRQHEEDHIQPFVLTRLLHKRQHTVLQLSKLLCIQGVDLTDAEVCLSS